MSNALFLAILGLLFFPALFWGFRVLPGEGWQVLAAMPGRRQDDGHWQGVNLTWYGLLTANAYLVAAVMAFVLLGAIRVPLPWTAATAALLLALCVPASKLVARLVEGKAHTFTVGGAVFVGILTAPGVVLLANRLLIPDAGAPVLPVLAALAVAYTFGEGLGRLACISFGCCYGKPVSEVAPPLRRLFERWHFVFFGRTKKIAYAGGLEGERVVPVQALTAVLYVGSGLAATALYLASHFACAFLLALLVTQGWRVASELLRADYRGEGKWSAYQIMGLLALPYALAMAWFFAGEDAVRPLVAAGLQSLWNPALLLALQALWLLIFFHTGRSAVTGARLSFHVHADRI